MSILARKSRGGANRTLALIFLGSCTSLFAQPASKDLTNVAILPLAAQGVDSTSAQVLTDALSDELLKSGKVRVMERSQMAEVLKEQGFQNSGSCDQSECAVQMGKLLGIEKIVVGSLGRFGNAYTLTLRGVNVGTGEVEVSVRRVQKGEMEAVLTDMLPSLAKELSGQLAGGKPPKAGAAPLPGAATANPVSTESVPASGEAVSGGNHLGLWIAGGVVLVGGAVAAVLLSGSGSETAAPAASPGTTNTNQTVHVVQP